MRVPAVLALDAGGIALDDLGHGRAAAADWERAGRALAQLHAHAAARFGFDADGYCGDSPQCNDWHDDGCEFFAACRLLPQARRARDGGHLTAADSARIERLCAGLREHVPLQPPVLVHGDLWLGNLHQCADGALALIDGGAVHYGWADADLAMLSLFGAPPVGFFDAYAMLRGSDGGWRAHAPLLNLYHLLNHLNLFGAGYRGAVRRVLQRYA